MTPLETVERELEKPSVDLSVKTFFNEQNVFITGATGFMGKVLLEKLLWSCENIKNIYLLLRTKKGQSAQERFDNLTKLPLYERLWRRNSNVFKKITVIEGDVTKQNLNMNDNDRNVLERCVTIVIHMASLVNFNDPLKKVILINVKGTLNILNFCTKIENLKVMTYVSTTFCNQDYNHIEEKVYSSDMSWKDVLKLGETYDEYTLAILTKKILKNHQNTYTFSKLTAENMVKDYSNIVPCTIFRPSVVTYSIKEPIPGWMDNKNGPVGVTIGIMTGILHVVYGDQDMKFDYIPCDYAINGILVVTCYRAAITDQNECIVFNGTIGMKDQRGISSTCLFRNTNDNIMAIPLENVLWFPSYIITKNLYLYYFLYIFMHILPGIIFDVILSFFGDFRVMKIYRKFFIFNQENSFFFLDFFPYNNKNFRAVYDFLSIEDKNTFFCNFDGTDIQEMNRFACLGIKKFILNENTDEAAIRRSQRNIKRFYRLHNGLKIFFYFLVLFIILKSLMWI